jgi:FeS assembly protein SufD
VASSVSADAPAALGVGKAALETFLEGGETGAIAPGLRRDALARFEELPLHRTIRSSRGWKRDLDKVDLSRLDASAAGGGCVAIEVSAEASARGVVAVPFADAARDHAELFSTARGSALDGRNDKFASLTLAFQNSGAFVYVPAGVRLDEPITIAYTAPAEGLFPYTLIVLESGAAATVIERFEGAAGAFVCGISEIVAAERAEARVVTHQALPDDATVVASRAATLGLGATLAFALAQSGADFSVDRTRVFANGRGANAELSVLFFADGARHVDVESEVVHAAPDTTSHTIVRTAGTGRGQGRYVGTIRILADAHGADASLRDDALLLSKEAHVDSVPALEIAANDVKAFHGATVGAISEDELFYAQSRGIARADAERMIALGFFEPALARFPGEALRERLRDGLAARLGGGVGA